MRLRILGCSRTGDEDRISTVMRHRRLVLLTVLGLVAAGLVGSAWAHPGHERTAHSASATTAVHESIVASESEPSAPASPDSRPPGRHHLPSAMALVAGAVTFLAAMPHRRRTLAMVLALLLGMVAFEGALHATLHLRNAPHADGLAIGVSSAQQPAPELDDSAPVPILLALLAETPRHHDPFVPEFAVAVNHGRAPPLFLA
jgi:hypothetical protein